MFTSIASAIKQFFGMVTTLCSAGEHGAKAIEHLAITAEETAAQFSDEARMKRAVQSLQLKAELKLTEQKTVAAVTAA